MNKIGDYRVYYYSGYANLIKMPGGHMFKMLSEVDDYIKKLRTRGRFKDRQFVLVEFFEKKESRIIKIINPDE